MENSVIIPAYNESNTIVQAVGDIKRNAKNFGCFRILQAGKL